VQTLLPAETSLTCSGKDLDVRQTTASVQLPLGLPGCLVHLGLHEPTTGLEHGDASFLLIMPSHSGLYRCRLIMRNYRRNLRERETEPGLSALMKFSASTSSTTGVGKKTDCGLGGRISTLVQLLVPPVGASSFLHQKREMVSC